MFFLNMLKESLIIISGSINGISLIIANKTSFFDFEFPISFLNIFGFLLIQKYRDNETVIDHDRKESGKKFDNISKL